jgi:DNA-binding beta-propeller fold protein YncE
VRVNPSTGYIYVPSAYNNNMVVLSDTYVVTTIPIGTLASLIDVNPTTGYIYAATNTDIKVLSGTEVITSHSIPYGLGGPFLGKVNPSTGYVYVGLTGNTVAVLSGTQLLTFLVVGWWPWGIDVNPNTGYVYVAINNNGSVTILSGTQFITNRAIGTASSQVAVNPATGYAYVGFSGGAAVFSGTDLITTLAVGWAHDIEANPTTGYVYFTEVYSNQVSIVSGTQVITSVATNTGPTAIGVNPNSGYVYVTNWSSNTVTVFSGTQIISVLDVGTTPEAIGINPTRGRVYVANLADYTVSVIQEPIVPKSLTPPVLSSSSVDIVIDFSEPVVTSTIQFTVSPAIPISVTWSALRDRAIIQHGPFEPNAEYTARVLSGGQTLSGAGILDRDFTFIYYPYRAFLPTALKNR